MLCCFLVAIPATCVFLSCCVWSLLHSLSKFLAKRWAAMVAKRREKSWIPGKERAEKMMADAITIDGRKEWICKFCSKSNVLTRWRCRRCYCNIPAGLRGKYRQAFSARTSEWSTGYSSSSGGEDPKSRVQEAEIKDLRAQVEQLRRQQRGEA